MPWPDGDVLVIVATGRRPGRPIFTIRPGASSDITLAEGETGDEIYRLRIPHGANGFSATPAISDGTLFIRAQNHLFAVSN